MANHRRHHMFSDREGDLHSPHLSGSTFLGRLKGFAHGHVGWLFKADSTAAERFAPELQRDRDAVVISRLFPVSALASLAIPLALGWCAWPLLPPRRLERQLGVPHVRTTALRDDGPEHELRAPGPHLHGESWPNLHRAYPAAARRGVGRGQIDLSAAVIRLLERAGWASKVRRPSERQIASVSTA